MAVTAAHSVDPGLPGLWKYTVTGSWAVGRHDLSHVDFFVALQECECVCDPRVIKFASPADPCLPSTVGAGTGDLSGLMPMCDCTTPARASTWGSVKDTYR